MSDLSHIVLREQQTVYRSLVIATINMLMINAWCVLLMGEGLGGVGGREHTDIYTLHNLSLYRPRERGGGRLGPNYVWMCATKSEGHGSYFGVRGVK